MEDWIQLKSSEMKLAQSGNRQHCISIDRSNVVFAEAIVSDSVDENVSSTQQMIEVMFGTLR